MGGLAPSRGLEESAQPQEWLKESGTVSPLGGLVCSGLCQELEKTDMFVSTLLPSPHKKPIQFRINMESVPSEIHNAKSRKDEDVGNLHLKWKSEYKVVGSVGQNEI